MLVENLAWQQMSVPRRQQQRQKVHFKHQQGQCRRRVGRGKGRGRGLRVAGFLAQHTMAGCTCHRLLQARLRLLGCSCWHAAGAGSCCCLGGEDTRLHPPVCLASRRAAAQRLLQPVRAPK